MTSNGPWFHEHERDKLMKYWERTMDAYADAYKISDHDMFANQGPEPLFTEEQIRHAQRADFFEGLLLLALVSVIVVLCVLVS